MTIARLALLLFTRRSLGVSGFLLSFSIFSYAQTLRGTVRDADNGAPLTGATVSIQFSRGAAAPISIATSPSGEFVFEKIRAGYYSVEIAAQDFENQVIAEVYVTSGKEQVLDIALHHATTALREVTILATQPGRRPLLPLGEIPLTRDQTLRFPAMYFDPARLAAAYPGVAQTDDGTNSLTIRGNGPSSVRWRLEGVDIVNPNHLPNAGTFSDRPGAASGGVLMFSAQMLDNSSLLTGAFPAGYGDALGGIMDMNLRRGNNRQHEFTAQAGLVGLDMAAEGPLGGRGRNSYLANYRYSTVGLLGQLGVSFGDEQINFQDFSFNLNFEGKNGGRLSIFGLGGLSENTFKHKTDTSEIKAYKDFFDIDFQSKTGVAGASYWWPVGKKTWIKTTVAFSEQTNDRSAVSTTYTEGGNADFMDESKLSGAVTISHRLRHRTRLSGGAMVMEGKFTGSGSTAPNTQEMMVQNYSLIQPWAQLSWRSRNQKNTTSAGFHSTLFKNYQLPYPKTVFALEPRFAFTRQVAKEHSVSASAGFYSQVPSVWFLGYDNDLISSWKIELAYNWNIVPEWSLRAAVYRQWIDNVPYFSNDKFWMLNSSEFRLHTDFVPNFQGRGRNEGIEITGERRLANGWFLLANLTLSQSSFSKGDTIYKNTKWDIGHLANLTFGKEWQREKRPGKERTIGLNARAIWTGGVREADILLGASSLAGTTVIDERIGYFKQYPDYFRLDLRVYWRKNLGNRRNSTFALDLQNLTNTLNLAYHYYDPYTGKIESKVQLGTIPNFSWRLEF